MKMRWKIINCNNNCENIFVLVDERVSSQSRLFWLFFYKISFFALVFHEKKKKNFEMKKKLRRKIHGVFFFFVRQFSFFVRWNSTKKNSLALDLLEVIFLLLLLSAHCFHQSANENMCECFLFQFFFADFNWAMSLNFHDDDHNDDDDMDGVKLERIFFSRKAAFRFIRKNFARVEIFLESSFFFYFLLLGKAVFCDRRKEWHKERKMQSD